jgi:hypothetical protein
MDSLFNEIYILKKAIDKKGEELAILQEKLQESIVLATAEYCGTEKKYEIDVDSGVLVLKRRDYKKFGPSTQFEINKENRRHKDEIAEFVQRNKDNLNAIKKRAMDSGNRREFYHEPKWYAEIKKVK